MKNRVLSLTQRCTLSCLGVMFGIRVENDLINTQTGRVFIQIQYDSVCTKSGSIESWNGRKYYLSEYMTDDEIIKTIYVAFESAVKHELMEGFKVDNIILFNPHINFEELLKISHKEVKRN